MIKRPIGPLPSVTKCKDPKWPQHIYECSNDDGKAVYQGGPQEFTIYDQRGYIITHLDIDIALTIASIVNLLIKEEVGENTDAT